MTPKTIFGREPAAVAATLEAALAVLGGLVFRWSDDEVGLVVAVVAALFGVYTAWATVDTLLGYVVGLIKAVLALAIGFGLHPDPRTAATLISFAVIAMGLFQRSSTSPVGTPAPAGPVLDPGSVASVVTPSDPVTPAAPATPPAADPVPTVSDPVPPEAPAEPAPAAPAAQEEVPGL